MKKFCTIAFFLLCCHVVVARKPLTLELAITRKFIKVEISSLGGHQGFCVHMKVKNLLKDSLELLLEPGSLLQANDNQQQNLLVVKECHVFLKANEEQTVNIKAYCCEATKFSPTKGAKYGYKQWADSQLVALANYLNTHIFNKEAEQDAVWAISNNYSLAHIETVGDTAVSQLRAYTAFIKGEELPWYTVEAKKYVYSNGSIVVFPVRLKGFVPYSVSGENYATLRVLNEQNRDVGEQKSGWLKGGSQQFYEVDLCINGLARGKYRIELRTDHAQVFLKEFEI
jgi:hypothetical protein